MTRFHSLLRAPPLMTYLVFVSATLFALYCLTVMIREAWTGVIPLVGGGTVRRDERPHLFWFINVCRGLPILVFLVVVALRRCGVLQ